MERVWGCEFKGGAHYVDATIDGRRVTAVGWGYRDPSPGSEQLRDHIAFYPGRVDASRDLARPRPRGARPFSVQAVQACMVRRVTTPAP
jgi:hypothetical protein